MKIVHFIVFLLVCYSVHSQSFSVFSLDTSDFPTIKAKFYAFDVDGKQILNLSPSDFTITENGTGRKITNVSCPSPKPPTALSSVLVMDASGSMGGGNLNLAKEAAKAWIEGLPLGKSECAISSFDHLNYLNQDFTTDRNKLLTSINSLQAMGGTDYDAALINPLAGGLLITKKGKYKKVIVFLSDGSPNTEPKTSQIIAEANSQNVTIYSVTLNMRCPQNMKDMSTQTGGQWFENVTTVEQARQIYNQILQTSQGGDPCNIEWESGVSCGSGITNYELLITNLGLTAKGSYKSPNSSVAKLEFKPATVKFDNPDIGVKTEQKVTVTALNANFTVTDIKSNNAAFEITPKSFVLNSGQSRELTVSYLPGDSGYVNCRFDVENDICPKKYYARGGWKGKKPTIRTLKLIHPNGGQVFVVGSDTVITWEGVTPEEPVKIDFSTNNGTNWITIAETATGLSYNWRVPKTPGNQCLARVTAEGKSGGNFDDDMVLIPAGTFQMGNTGAYSGYTYEKPVHQVTISRDFFMSKYEITQAQYLAVMETNPSFFKGDSLPVEQVSWYDAVAFCNKLSILEGLEECYTINGTDVQCNWNANGYRLPTEAEWEYACKAGTTSDFYNGSLTNPDCTPLDNNLDKIGWYCGNENTKTREVGQKQANDFGLYDMSGNVWEWCWDWYGTYDNTSVTDPNGALSGSSRVYRGGSWNRYAFICRSAARSYYDPDFRNNRLGFRVVSPK